MEIFRKKTINQIADEGMVALKNVLGYLLLPIAIPIMFVQEVISFIREKTGLRRRTLEGKVPYMNLQNQLLSISKLFWELVGLSIPYPVRDRDVKVEPDI